MCRFCQGKPCLPPASPSSPNYRVSFNHPFEVTGIDYKKKEKMLSIITDSYYRHAVFIWNLL